MLVVSTGRPRGPGVRVAAAAASLPIKADRLPVGVCACASPLLLPPSSSQIVSPRDITEKSYDVMRAYDELYDLHEFMRENT